jgi:hypothetical protein
MMVFNLTRNAMEHLFPDSDVKKQAGIIQHRKGGNIVLYERDTGYDERIDFVFNVHTIRVKRLHCIIAIEKDSRWVHVIHNVAKGDVNEFCRRLHERLINGIANMIAHAKLTEALLGKSIVNYFAANNDMLFFYKSDRSCNTHSAQVARIYIDSIDECGFPDEELDALLFDMHQNAVIRKTSKSGDYFFPAEDMLEKYLRQYTRMTETEIQDAIKRNRKAWIIPGAGGIH